MTINMTYAMKEGNLVHISEIDSSERGHLCNCTCINCGKPVLAKLGTSKVNHFAHKSDKCLVDKRELLKLYVLHYILTNKSLFLPTVIMQYDRNPLFDRNFYFTPKRLRGKRIKTISKAMNVRFSNVSRDKYFKQLFPDIVLYKGKEPFIIYLSFGEEIDGEKIKKIMKSKVNALVINLSDFLTKQSISNKESLEDLVCRRGEHKYWIYNREYETQKEMLKDETKFRLLNKNNKSKEIKKSVNE